MDTEVESLNGQISQLKASISAAQVCSATRTGSMMWTRVVYTLA
jgi:hypothetical protein